MLLFVLACNEYRPSAIKDNEGADDTAGPSDSGSTNLENSECPNLNAPIVDCGTSDACDYGIGGFEPVVEWEIPGHSDALPVVADLDGDGMPEVIVNIMSSMLSFSGELQVWSGDGSREQWSDNSRKIAYGSHPAVADLDDDGFGEVIAVVDTGQYSLGCWSYDGQFLWQTESFSKDFNWATGPLISDMDHDGSPEIVAGRVIFNADGTTRGVGSEGKGASAGSEFFIEEGAHPAVTDLDLDGVEEVIAGNTIYDPDGNELWHDPFSLDGAVAIANLDADPEGEFVVSVGNEYRAHDTDGSILWGPERLQSANILSVPTVGDIDQDGMPEIILAGGNELRALNHDGSLLWKARVTDQSGATGASIFDFDADGIPEVVYIDEVEMIAFNGLDGAIKFHSTEHGSATMYDYPTIADVDNDGHAEILVAHDQWSSGISVYGDAQNSWAPARKVWNQHGYSITNINDDLSVPVTATPSFTLYNSYHSGVALPPGETLGDDLQVEVVSTCTEDCDDGYLRVVVRVLNKSNRDLDPGIPVSLYVRTSGGDILSGTQLTQDVIVSGKTNVGMVFSVEASLAKQANGLIVRADDNGSGTGIISECVENDNEFYVDGSFCQ